MQRITTHPLIERLRADWHRPRFIYRTCAALLAFCTLLSLHGFSIPSWHGKLGGGSEPEILIGTTKDLRSDDWALDLPIVMGQRTSPDAFSPFNANIGTGEVAVIPFRVPAKHWVTFFRPVTWGFFVGIDTGLAWMWWTLALGCFLSFYLLLGEMFTLASEERALFSLIFLYSPYLQIWAFHTAEIIFQGLFALYFAIRILKSTSKSRTLLLALPLGYCGAAMVLGYMYPPRIIPVFWVIVAGILGYCIDHWEKIKQDHFTTKVLSLLGGGILAGGLVAAFIYDFREVVQTIQQTIYPGQRFSLGGHMPWNSFLSAWYFAPSTGRLDSVLGNHCENSGFFLIFPVAVAFWGWRRFVGKKPIPFLAIALIAVIAMLTIFNFYEVPRWYAQATLLFKGAPNRVKLGTGIADLLILILLFQYRDDFKLSLPSRKIIYGSWMTLLAWAGIALLPNFNFGLKPVLFLPLFFAGYVFYYWIVKNEWRWFLKMLLATTFFSTIMWNPIVHGGGDLLLHNPLSEKMTEIHDKEKTDLWAVLGDGVMANLPRIVGIHCLDGYHLYPDFKLWKMLDPEGKFMSVYNMNAYVSFFVATDNQQKIVTTGPGQIEVYMPIERQYFERLGVTHLLFHRPENVAAAKARLNPGAQPLFDAIGSLIIQVKDLQGSPESHL